MARVSENSSYHAINYSVGKTKRKLEDLQLQGSNLKRIQKPSDDPVGNIDLLTVRSKQLDNKQYLRNASFAKTQLVFTETAVEELTDILVKAKELAIGQASSFYNKDIRESVAKEIEQLAKQSLSISNRRLGNRYIFSGHKTLTRPFNEKGEYAGDKNQTSIEVSKDFFVKINFSGDRVFFEKEDTAIESPTPIKLTTQNQLDRRPASLEETNKEQPQKIDQRDLPLLNPPNEKDTMLSQRNDIPNKGPSRKSVFGTLKRLENALVSNSHESIQAMLPDLDLHIDRLIQLRTEIGSISNSIENAEENIEKVKVMNEEYKSKIQDSDVAELFTDLTRQQNTLNATYKSSAQLMNNNLLKFIG